MPPAPPSGQPPVSTAQHRISVSGRPRRPSPLLHEIQPPSRRLSAHQVLLLTPFGEPLPGGAPPMPMGRGSFGRTSTGDAGGTGMTRVPSSQGGSSMTRSPSSAGWSTGSVSKRGSMGMVTGRDRGSVGMSVGSSAMGRDAPPSGMMARENRQSTMPPRTRHHSLANPTAHPSPLSLSSAPMTTILSASDNSSSEGRGSTLPSREPSHGQQDDADEDDLGFVPPVVHMTRSNSLPVLTLRELEALKEKDGELGIARGSSWAWVSREGVDDESMDERCVSLSPGHRGDHG